jgi:hypothetical protein
MTWRFRLHLKDLAEISDELADQLYAACPDATIASSCGRAWISFDRDSDSLPMAIRTAVADIRRLGLDVGRVEIEASELAEAELDHWQQPA